MLWGTEWNGREPGGAVGDRMERTGAGLPAVWDRMERKREPGSPGAVAEPWRTEPI